jgi:hypothetical protein
MLSIRAHAAINLALNLVVLSCVLAGLGVDYFEFSVRPTQDYKVGVWTLSYIVQLKDVSGRLYTSFANFDAFACERSKDQDILALCDSLLHLRVAGAVFTGLSLALVGGLLVSCLNLLMLLLLSENWAARTRFTHYLNPVLYFSACCVYLLVSQVDAIEELRAEFGVCLMFVTASAVVVTFTHYFYLWRFDSLRDLTLLTKGYRDRSVSPSYSDPRPGILFRPQLSPKQTERDKDAEILQLLDGISELKAQVRKMEMDRQESGLVKREMEVYRAKYENLRDSLRSTEGVAALIEQLDRQDSEIIRLHNQLQTAKQASPTSPSEVQRENARLKQMLSELSKAGNGRNSLDVIGQGGKDSLVSETSEVVLHELSIDSELSIKSAESRHRKERGLKLRTQLLTDKQIQLEILKSELEASRGSVTEAQVRQLEAEVLEIQGSSAALSPHERLKLEKQRELLQLRASPGFGMANWSQLAVVKAQMEVIETSEGVATIEELEQMLDTMQLSDDDPTTQLSDEDPSISKLVRAEAAKTLAQVIQIRKESSPEEIRHQKEQELVVLRAAYNAAPNSILLKKVQQKQRELAMLGGSDDANRPKETAMSFELSCSLSIPSALISDPFSEVFRSLSNPLDTAQQLSRLTGEVSEATKCDDLASLEALKQQFRALIKGSSGLPSQLSDVQRVKDKLEELKQMYRTYQVPNLNLEIQFYQELLDDVAASEQASEAIALAGEVEELRKALNENDEHYSRELKRQAHELRAKSKEAEDTQARLTETNQNFLKASEELRDLRKQLAAVEGQLTEFNRARPKTVEVFTQYILELKDSQATDQTTVMLAKELKDKEIHLAMAREAAEIDAANSEQALERLQLQLDNAVRRAQYLESDQRGQTLELQMMESELMEAKDHEKLCEAKLNSLTEDYRRQTEELEAASIKYGLKELDLKRLQVSYEELLTSQIALEGQAQALRAALKVAEESLKRQQREVAGLEGRAETADNDLRLREERMKGPEAWTTDSRAEAAVFISSNFHEESKGFENQSQGLETHIKLDSERITQIEELLKRNEAAGMSFSAEEQDRMKLELDGGFMQEFKADFGKRLTSSEYRESNLMEPSKIGEIQVQRSQVTHKAEFLESELSKTRLSIQSLEETLEDLRVKDS